MLGCDNMMHIIVLILKIIGILILGLLGLLLSLVLLVILVPIRYKVKGSYYGTPKGTVKVTWLLHILSVVVSFEEELLVSIRILGIRMFRDRGEHTEEFLEDVTEFAVEPPLYAAKETLKDAVRPISDPVTGEKVPTSDISGSEDEKSSLFHDRWKKYLEKVKIRCLKVCAGIGYIKQYLEKFWAVLQNPENQYTFKLVWRQVKKLMIHLRPRKAKASITFGFDDPYTTGQVLSAASIGYVWYGEQIQITPVFDEEIIEGEGNFQGRVRIGTLLFLGLRIFLNKNFRVLLKKAREIGGV